MGSYNQQEDANIIFENSNNVKQITKIEKGAYYEMTINLLEKELGNLEHFYSDINSDIIHYKYKVFSQEKELLNKKRFPEINENKLDTEEKNKEEEKANKNKKNDGKKNNIKNESNIKLKDNKKNIKKTTNAYSSRKSNRINDDLKEKISFYEYNEDFQNSGILIKQKNPYGKTLDLGILLGPYNQKTFIGFQMKYYEKGTHLKKVENFTKDRIKESIQSILLCCLKEFNIRITSWHYIFCIYFNSKEPNSYNKSLVNSCNKSDIEFILYDPYEEAFYSRDFKPINDEIKLTYRSNFDCLSSSNPYIIFNNNDHIEYYSSQRLYSQSNLLEEKDVFKIPKSQVFDILRSILDENFEMVYKFVYCWKHPFPIPKKNYLFLFNNYEHNKENNYIYYYNIDDDNFKCGNFQGETYDAGKISNYVEYPIQGFIEFYVFKALIKNKKNK